MYLDYMIRQRRFIKTAGCCYKILIADKETIAIINGLLANGAEAKTNRVIVNIIGQAHSVRVQYCIELVDSSLANLK